MVSRFQQFTAAVASIYRSIQKIERVEMARFGLKGPQAQCLVAMAQYPEGITASRLCTICDKDKAAISRTLVELEQAGLVQRYMRGENRYRALLKVTEQGKIAAEHVAERAKLAVQKASEGMTEEQRVALYKMLTLIADHLQIICEEGLENA